MILFNQDEALQLFFADHAPQSDEFSDKFE